MIWTDFQDYFYGYMVPSTGYLKYFELLLYEDGFVLVFPYEDTKKTAVFETSKKLYHTLMEAAAWAKQMQIRTVGELNEQIVKGKVQDIILLQEAEMEKRISKIAEQIAAEKNKKVYPDRRPFVFGKDDVFPQDVDPASGAWAGAASDWHGQFLRRP